MVTSNAASRAGYSISTGRHASRGARRRARCPAPSDRRVTASPRLTLTMWETEIEWPLCRTAPPSECRVAQNASDPSWPEIRILTTRLKLPSRIPTSSRGIFIELMLSPRSRHSLSVPWPRSQNARCASVRLPVRPMDAVKHERLVTRAARKKQPRASGRLSCLSSPK